MNIDERRQRRLASFLDVGITLLGAAGGSSISVRGACRAASLTERYFYESFSDRDAYVRAVYSYVGERARSAIETAVHTASDVDKAEAPVRAFVDLVLDDPAVGRVLLLAPLSEPAIGGSGAALVPTFVKLVQDQLSDADAEEQQLIAIGVVGALTSLFAGYLDGTVTAPRERFATHCVRLVADAGQRTRGVTQPLD